MNLLIHTWVLSLCFHSLISHVYLHFEAMSVYPRYQKTLFKTDATRWIIYMWNRFNFKSISCSWHMISSVILKHSKWAFCHWAVELSLDYNATDHRSALKTSYLLYIKNTNEKENVDAVVYNANAKVRCLLFQSISFSLKH